MKPARALLALLGVSWAVCASAETPRRPDELTIAPVRFQPVEAKRETLSIGMPVLYYENHDLPLLSITIALRMGRRFLPPEEFTACRLFGDLWETGGTRDLPPDSLDARCAALAASIEAWIAPRSGEVTAFMASEDARAVLPLWRDVLLHPRFDASRLSRAKAQAIKDLQAIDNDPERIADIRFSRLLHGDGYPGDFTDTRATIDAVGETDLVRLHRRFVRPENAVIGLSGDFEPRRTLAYLDSLLSDWPRSDPYEPPVAAPWIPRPQPGVYLLPGDFEQSQVRIGRLLPGITNRSPEYPLATILSFAFGYGRVYYRTREEGLSYATGILLRVGEEEASLYGTGSCRGEVTGRLIRVMIEEAERLWREPLTPEEVGTARIFQIGGMIRDDETPRSVVGGKADEIVRGLPDDYRRWKFRRLEEATPAAIDSLARRTVRFDDSTVVLVLGDPKTFDLPTDSLGFGATTPLPPIRFGD